MPTTYNVADEADLNAALTQIDLTGSSSAPNTAYMIALGGNIALTTDLYAVNLAQGDTLTIEGNGHALDGGGDQRGLFVYAGTVSVSDLAIDNAAATGGNGAGGGAGLGGGLFVASGGAVTLNDVTFAGDAAVGGNGFVSSIGGGGGLGGDGSALSGGGGIGHLAFDTFGDSNGAGSGIVLGAASGGAGGPGLAGGANGGAGGGVVSGGPSIGGGGGGIGGQAGSNGGVGGNGGFGGGGGFFTSNGGFGGGGGSYGSGGFGGGGGNGYLGAVGGFGGFGGGNASGPVINSLSGQGGGGLGAGGAVFVQQGGSLVFAGGDVSGDIVTGGTGDTYTFGMPYPDSKGSAFGSGIFLQGNEQVTLSASASQTLTIGDVIADQTGSTHQTGLTVAGDPLSGAGSLRIEGQGTVRLSAANTYVGGTSLAGTLELAVPGAAGSGDIVFDPRNLGRAELDIDGTTMPSNSILAFAGADTIDLRGVRFDSADTLTVSTAHSLSTLTVSAGGMSYVLNLADLAFSVFPGLSAAADGSVLVSATACYAAGTHIATPGAEVLVEDLRAGDRVSLAAGGSATVRWVGHRRLDLRRHPRPRSVQPVRVRAGSFGDGLPMRDLVLSPEHALFIDGALVPVSALIDGESVVQEAWDRVCYHHVELECHDVILAEGLPAESYLDTGNRHHFANGALASLHPHFRQGDRPTQPCAPLVLDGPVVEAARAALRRMARAA